MATITGTVALGSVHSDGRRNVRINDAATADVTLSFDNTKVKTKGDLMMACRTLIDHFGSDQLK